MFFGHSCLGFPTEQRFSLLRWSHSDWPLDNDGSALLFITLKVKSFTFQLLVPSLVCYFFVRGGWGLLLKSFLPLFVKGGSRQCESGRRRLRPASPWWRGADLDYQVDLYAREVPLYFAVELRHSTGRVGAARSVWQVSLSHTHKLTSLSTGQLGITSPLLWSQQEVAFGQCASPCSRRPSLQKAAAS